VSRPGNGGATDLHLTLDDQHAAADNCGSHRFAEEAPAQDDGNEGFNATDDANSARL